MQKTIIKVFADTNILVSSILYPLSNPKLALQKAGSYPFCLYTSRYCFEELTNVFNSKFPHMLSALEEFFKYDFNSIIILNDDNQSLSDEALIRDPMDQIIINTAIGNKMDLIITGDKDFLESGLTHPLPVSPRDFLDNY